MEVDDLVHTDRLKKHLDGLDDETLWNVATTAAAIGAGLAARTVLKSGWRRMTGDEPPRNPAASSVGWGDALAWTVATGVAVGVARLLARRGAAAGWETVTGDAPPV